MGLENGGSGPPQNYWQKRLAGKEPLLLVPTDRHRGGSTGIDTNRVRRAWAMPALAFSQSPCSGWSATPVPPAQPGLLSCAMSSVLLEQPRVAAGAGSYQRSTPAAACSPGRLHSWAAPCGPVHLRTPAAAIQPSGRHMRGDQPQEAGAPRCTLGVHAPMPLLRAAPGATESS